MKPYAEDSNAGRTKAIDDIHHRTQDGGQVNRSATAKAQRKAARRDGKRQADSLRRMGAEMGNTVGEGIKQMTDHTPGPWRWELNENSKVLHLVGGKPLVDLSIIKPTRCGMVHPDMRLIEAAPDMLEALRKAVVLLAAACVHARELEPGFAYEAVSAAIAKATGCADELIDG